jgi:hypothetical protein
VSKSKNGLLGILDEHLQREQLRIGERDRQLEEAKVTVDRLQGEVEDLRQDLASKRKGFEKDQKGYLKIVSQLEGRITKGLETQQKLESSFKGGEINISQYQARMKTEGTIRAEARAGIQAELEQVRPVLRQKNQAIIRVGVEILRKNSRIVNLTQGLIQKHLVFLEGQSKMLGQYASNFTHSMSERQLEQAEAELLCSEAGGLIGSSFEASSFEDLELLALESKIQPRHFEDLENKIMQLQEDGWNFSIWKLGIDYSAKDGFIRFQESPVIRPRTAEARVLQTGRANV